MIPRDAFRLLGALGAQSELLSDLAPEARRAGLFLVRKALKAPELTLDRLKALQAAIGEPAMAEAVSGLSRTAAGEIVKRLDRRNPHARGPAHALDETWARARILALATGAARPMPRASALGAGPATPPEPEALALALREARAPERREPSADPASGEPRRKSA
ncbi:MAG: hypothetical protein AAFW46_10320 [Pseudomonadota bacterium]